MASFMSAAMSSAVEPSSSESRAVMPCGTVLVGTTTTFFFVIGAHCSAAMIMFLLLGSTNTVSAGVRSTARRMSSVEGFMVCPPVTMLSAPSSRKSSAMPAPAQTATAPKGFSGSANSISGSFSGAGAALAAPPPAISLCCSRMFSIFTFSSGP